MVTPSTSTSASSPTHGKMSPSIATRISVPPVPSASKEVDILADNRTMKVGETQMKTPDMQPQHEMENISDNKDVN
jgi:hypothetical protein